MTPQEAFLVTARARGPGELAIGWLGMEARTLIFTVGKRDYSIASNHADVTVRHTFTRKCYVVSFMSQGFTFKVSKFQGFKVLSSPTELISCFDVET